MKHRIDRRDFLRTGGAVGAGLALGAMGGVPAMAAGAVKSSSPSADKLGWPVSCAQYTFRRFTLYETLDMLAQLGIRCVEPGFFLRLDKNRPDLKANESLSTAQRTELKSRLVDRGMSMASFYSSLGTDENAAREVFGFAKHMGITTLVAEPPAEAFDMLEKLCEQYQVNLAVHNHPKAPNYKYWEPEGVLAVCKGRSQRIGACCDTGHWVRSGLDPVACLKKMEGRIKSFHLKDVAEWGKPGARDVPLGTGKANYAAVLAELKRQKFQGIMAIEYEHDSPQLMDDVAKCVAFVEKTAKELAG